MPAPATAVLTVTSPQLANLAGQAVRRVTVDRIAAGSGSAEAVRIGRIDVGDASVDRVTVENLGATVHCGAALLRNVRMIMEMRFKVRWAYDLGWFGADSGIKELGSKAKTFELNDINLPRLEDIAVQVPMAEISGVTAEVRPIENLALGSGRFEGLAIEEMTLPSDGFGLAGMGLDGFELGSFGAPEADSRRLTLDRFAPDAPLNLPGLTLRDIEVTDIAVPDAGSDGPVSINGIELEEFEAPVFKIGKVFKANFMVVPILHMQIAELVLTDLSASAAVGAAGVEGIAAPVEISRIEMEGLNLKDLGVTRVAL